MKNSEKLVILFDGSCPFCTATAKLLRILDWRHRLHCLPFQASGIPQAYGLAVAQCERVLWAISPDGNSYQGAQAVSAALDTIVGLPLFRLLYQVKGIGQIVSEPAVHHTLAAANHERNFYGTASLFRQRFTLVRLRVRLVVV